VVPSLGAMTVPLDLLARAVLFDVDGTLVDSTVVVEAMWAGFAARHGLDPTVVVPAAHGRQTIDTIRDFLPDASPADQDQWEREFTAEEVRRTDGIVEVPGAGALTRQLLALDVPIAVVTSASRELATARMVAAGVPVPQVLVSPAEIRRGKPDPQGYLHAAALLGAPIGQCIIFEDAEAGVAAAVASGGQVVVVGDHESARTAGLPRVPDLRSVTAEWAGDRIRLRT
jgi:mannitol-1-/sugar-/sorbitol-6-phosphatase